ncbi:MAG: serine protease [Syntrophobacteraceae bacterium]
MIKRAVQITVENPDLAMSECFWGRPEFSADDGIGPLASLYQAGDAIIAIGGYFDEQFIIVGSGVMISPGLMLTATHVLKEFPRSGSGPVFLTFLQGGATRAWIPTETVTASGQSEFVTFNEHRKKVSDLSLVSCALHSDAHASYPLSLAPIELCLPLPEERLWAIGYKHGSIEQNVTGLTPLVASGIVKRCFANGRGERMPSICVEVAMECWGGMSGGPVYNKDGRLVGIVSSSFDGGPTYVTLIWDAMRLWVKSPQDGIWPCQEMDLFKGKKLGLVRIKGRVRRDADWKVILKLSKKEMEFLMTSG